MQNGDETKNTGCGADRLSWVGVLEDIRLGRNQNQNQNLCTPSLRWVENGGGMKRESK